jgi:hypothetical protein
MKVVPLSMHSDFASRPSAGPLPVARSSFPKDAQALIYKASPSCRRAGRTPGSCASSAALLPISSR